MSAAGLCNHPATKHISTQLMHLESTPWHPSINITNHAINHPTSQTTQQILHRLSLKQHTRVPDAHSVERILPTRGQQPLTWWSGDLVSNLDPESQPLSASIFTVHYMYVLLRGFFVDALYKSTFTYLLTVCKTVTEKITNRTDTTNVVVQFLTSLVVLLMSS